MLGDVGEAVKVRFPAACSPVRGAPGPLRRRTCPRSMVWPVQDLGARPVAAAQSPEEHARPLFVDYIVGVTIKLYTGNLGAVPADDYFEDVDYINVCSWRGRNALPRYCHGGLGRQRGARWAQGCMACRATPPGATGLISNLPAGSSFFSISLSSSVQTGELRGCHAQQGRDEKQRKLEKERKLERQVQARAKEAQLEAMRALVGDLTSNMAFSKGVQERSSDGVLEMRRDAQRKAPGPLLLPSYLTRTGPSLPFGLQQLPSSFLCGPSPACSSPFSPSRSAQQQPGPAALLSPPLTVADRWGPFVISYLRLSEHTASSHPSPINSAATSHPPLSIPIRSKPLAP
ncbi:hypothetical protein HU200_052673 [Digitaria exilis]|uniref:Uncharacterized protein n=1 Tax=Digitaria exilis TaxID=1010633 RepID=A0A835E5P9_9POAL|nr:hypothetical protein HU200_052673 [Digitaria exilis]